MTFRRSISSSERLRLFELHHHVCHCCGNVIDPIHERWDVEHVVPWALTRDDSDANRKPAHRTRYCHGAKTKIDIGNIARAKRREQKFKGAWRSAQPMPGGRDSDFKHKMRGGWERRT
jgi:hypothetical protein